MKVTVSHNTQDISAFRMKPGQFGIVTHHYDKQHIGKVLQCFEDLNGGFHLLVLGVSSMNNCWPNFTPSDNIHFLVRLIEAGQTITIEV